MTVAELIKKLQEVENQDLKIHMHMDGCCSTVWHISIDTDSVNLCDAESSS